jgi:hypothetical protein
MGMPRRIGSAANAEFLEIQGMGKVEAAAAAPVPKIVRRLILRAIFLSFRIAPIALLIPTLLSDCSDCVADPYPRDPVSICSKDARAAIETLRQLPNVSMV